MTFKTFACVVPLLLPALAVAQPERTFQGDPTSVPPALEQDFARAIKAWGEFTREEQALLDAMTGPRAAHPFAAREALLGDPSLHRYLYPWATRQQLARTTARPQAVDGQAAALPAVEPVAPVRIAFRVFSVRELKYQEVLTVSYEDTGPHDPLVVPAQRLSGKWYWEVQYHARRSRPEGASAVGVGEPRSSSPTRGSEVLGLTDAIRRTLRGGEVLRFALDLDRAVLHVGVDGVWFVGDPAGPEEGRALGAGRAFAPAIRVASPDRDPYESDVFTFNFGASPFRYRIPEGFEPYDIRERAARLAEAPKMSSRGDSPSAAQFDEALRPTLAAVAEGLQPNARAALDRTAAAWRAYRDAACTLTARYARLGAGQAASIDVGCLAEFTGSFQERVAYLLSRAPTTPRAMPSGEPPRFDAAEKLTLHYVQFNGSARTGQSGRYPVEVLVSDTSAPLVLFLRAYGPTEWRVKIAPGVALRYLVLFGQYKQTTTVEGGTPSIRAYSAEEGNSQQIWSILHKGDSSRLDLAELVERIVGVRVATLQFDCPRDLCAIDGKRSWRYRPVSAHSGEPVVWVLRGQPVASGKRIENPDRGPGETVRASEARNRGKWYFEVKADPLPPERKAWAGGTVGVVVADSTDQYSDLLYRDSITAGTARRLAPGGVVNVALDLDAARVWYGIDGRWIDGDPQTANGGKPLKKGRDYFPAIQFYSGHNIALERRLLHDEVERGTWVGRFSAAELEYPVPDGYRPYESPP